MGRKQRHESIESIDEEKIAEDPALLATTILDTILPDSAATIQMQQEEAEAALKAIRARQIEATAANAVTHYAGGASPVQIPNPNACPICGAIVSTYAFIKACNACGWRSDHHQMQPYE